MPDPVERRLGRDIRYAPGLRWELGWELGWEDSDVRPGRMSARDELTSLCRLRSPSHTVIDFSIVYGKQSSECIFLVTNFGPDPVPTPSKTPSASTSATVTYV